MLNRFVVVYLDDILIYSSSLLAHIAHVKSILHRLLDHELYVKAKKYDFHKPEILFLGCRIGPLGVNMEEIKVTAVSEWSEPDSVKQLQQFLGFTNVYLCFIQGFSFVAAPLTDMLKGNTPAPQGCPRGRLFVFLALQNRVIEWAHTLSATGHPGGDRALSVLTWKY